MKRHDAIRSRLLMLMAAMTLLSACSSSQPAQPVARDNADRLFLKLVDIARQPSPPKGDDLIGLRTLIEPLGKSSDYCTSQKDVYILETGQWIMEHDLKSDNSATWAEKSADMRRELHRVQAAPVWVWAPDCDGHGFPQGTI